MTKNNDKLVLPKLVMIKKYQSNENTRRSEDYYNDSKNESSYSKFTFYHPRESSESIEKIQYGSKMAINEKDFIIPMLYYFN